MQKLLALIRPRMKAPKILCVQIPVRVVQEA